RRAGVPAHHSGLPLHVVVRRPLGHRRQAACSAGDLPGGVRGLRRRRRGRCGAGEEGAAGFHGDARHRLVPSIFLLPWLANAMGLTDAVTGAWIGGNIDTTAAVTAAGAVAGEGPLQIASIVKVTQNALLGVVAVLLTIFFAFKVGAEASPGTPKRITDPAAVTMLWGRFPKFVLGFLAASVIATVLGQTMSPEVLEPRLDAAQDIQVWALTLAFVSIGLEFKVQSAKDAGWKPVAVFAAATLVNLVVGLALAA